MNHMFSRNIPGITDILLSSSVGIAGCGGLGSHVADSLTRAGTGKLVIADYDRVELSNLNRQLYFRKDVGRLKAEVLRERLLDIRPDMQVEICCEKLTGNNVSDVFADTHILVEAFDTPENKRMLVEEWMHSFPKKNIVSASGLGGAGRLNDISVTCKSNLYICGDGKSDMSLGLSAGRVAVVANMQAEVVISLLAGKEVM
ncbi:MAG: sulfur carrier protein ThiS adenylyltransferase ThiF [bacterium]